MAEEPDCREESFLGKEVDPSGRAEGALRGAIGRHCGQKSVKPDFRVGVVPQPLDCFASRISATKSYSDPQISEATSGMRTPPSARRRSGLEEPPCPKWVHKTSGVGLGAETVRDLRDWSVFFNLFFQSCVWGLDVARRS